jgi:hypothetical protein
MNPLAKCTQCDLESDTAKFYHRNSPACVCAPCYYREYGVRRRDLIYANRRARTARAAGALRAYKQTPEFREIQEQLRELRREYTAAEKNVIAALIRAALRRIPNPADDGGL